MTTNSRRTSLFLSSPPVSICGTSKHRSKNLSYLARSLGRSNFSEKKFRQKLYEVRTIPKSLQDLKLALKPSTPHQPSSVKSEELIEPTMKRKVSSQRNTMPELLIPEGHNYVAKCAYKTRTGTVQGRSKKFNQDSFLVYPYVQNKRNSYFFGVFDGHGSNGHKVSQFVKTLVGKSIEEALNDTFDPSHSMKLAVEKVCNSLDSANIDCANSGTTLTMLHIDNDTLTLANIGDSRAVLGKRINGDWVSCQLTTDHKPSLHSERVRILKANGRVMPCISADRQRVGPDRVWLATESTPGLAMSRSIGDKIAKRVGVISEPELTTLKLSTEDKFIVLGTDGVWEFLSNEEIISTIGLFLEQNNTEKCCTEIVEWAVSRWNREDDGVDDITIIIIFFNS